MNFHSRLFLCAIGLTLIAVACDKDDKDVAANMQNIAGTYRVTRITIAGSNANWLDSADVCERDNLIRLNTDSTASLIDAGEVCDPPSNENGNWHVRADSIFVNTEASKIKAFDGKQLILESSVDAFGTPVTTTSTLTKQ